MTKNVWYLLFFTVLSFRGISQNLISATLLGTKTQTELYNQFDNLPFIQFGASYYRIEYTTTGVHGVPDTVTGLLAVPDNPARIYPRLVYQHGTSGSRLDVPSINVLVNGEGQLGQLFAGLGYVSLLPDYLGLGYTSKGFHPYVHAASEARTAMDMLRAVDQFCTQNQIVINDQLFVTGYSQGGHGAMALHRAIENDPGHEFKVTAAAPMSGPYSVSGVMRQLILSDDIYYYPAYIPNTALSYQTVYGNLFSDLTEVFKPVYAAPIGQFYAGQMGLSDLNEQLIALLQSNEGASRPFRMLQPDLVQAISTNPAHPINLALADNDTYNNWTPQAPMRLFYCMNDDQVPFANSVVARDSLNAVGAPNFMAQDVMPGANHGQCVVPAVTGTLFFFLGFQQIGTVGSKDPDPGLKLDIFPNPAQGEFFIDNVPADGFLEVIDFQGHVVFSKPLLSGSHVCATEDLSNGFYVVRFSSGTQVWKGKLLVRR